MLTTYEKQGKKKLAAIIASTLIVAAAVVFIDQSKGKSGTSHQATDLPTTDPDPTATPPSAPVSTSGSSLYRDGNYSASASYRVPRTIESIRVSVTLKNGTVTAVSVENSEGDRESATYQAEFTARYKSYVIGQKIDGLNLSVIAGASETTQGFNQAVSQISQQAQA